MKQTTTIVLEEVLNQIKELNNKIQEINERPIEIVSPVADGVLTVEELCEYFRIGKSTSYELTKLRGFPVIRVGSKKMVIPKRKLAEWIDKQTTVGKSEITPAVAQGIIKLRRKES